MPLSYPEEEKNHYHILIYFSLSLNEVQNQNVTLLNVYSYLVILRRKDSPIPYRI